MESLFTTDNNIKNYKFELSKIKYIRENANTFSYHDESSPENNRTPTEVFENTYTVDLSIIDEIEWFNTTLDFTHMLVKYTYKMQGNPFEIDNTGIIKTSMRTLDRGTNIDVREFSQEMREEIHNKNDAISESERCFSESHPFFKYREPIIKRYRKLLIILKGLYSNILKLPNSEKIIHTIDKEFKLNHIFLKNPEFMFDDYIYHIYNYNKITTNYEISKQILKTFEYICYSLYNYRQELEFDIFSYENVRTTDKVKNIG